MTDPQTMASKLTDPMKRYILGNGCSATSVPKALLSRALIEPRGGILHLTPLGEQVRTHLEKESKK